MTYKYYIAANQDWTGDLFFTIGQATLYKLTSQSLRLTFKLTRELYFIFSEFQVFFEKIKKAS